MLPFVGYRLSPLRFALLMLSILACTLVWVFMYGGFQPVDGANWYGAEYRPDGSRYIWSPAFAQLSAPLRALPFDAFVAVVRAVELVCLVALAPFGAFVAIWLPPVAAEVNSANINMLLTLFVVLGMRWPFMWTLPLLTKPSMGLGLLWFLTRKEWRNFAIAVIPAAVIAAVSFVYNPQLWIDWVRMLANFSDTPGWPFPYPLWPRIPIAVVLVIWGARTNRPWTVMAATFIAWPRAVLPVAGDPHRPHPADGALEVAPHEGDLAARSGRRVAQPRLALAGRVAEGAGLNEPVTPEVPAAR